MTIGWTRKQSGGGSVELHAERAGTGWVTPLRDALKTEPGQGRGNVPAPKGYGAIVNPGESSGLINPKERQETQAYLETLASE